jgi:orotidine-5'-phosphate decarboxylase
MPPAGSPACVGLDPVLERLPAPVRAQHADPVAAIHAFCAGVVDAVAGLVPVVKPQSACFERYGPPGVAALHALIAHARSRGLIVVLDAKRGDIGLTAEHYAHAAFDSAGADAVTLSGYMGPDTIEPFLGRPGTGVFVLVRTSNPGSDAVQAQRLADGRSVAELIADMVHTLGMSRSGARGLSDVGAVVGATKSADAAALRARMPNTIFLIPGYGAQGGTLDDVRACVRPGAKSPGDLGVLVNASRSVLYPAGGGGDGPDFAAHVRAAAARLRDELAGLATT